MARYFRPQRPGATVFFTLCLEQSGDTRLVDDILRLRAAFRQVQATRPFTIETCVVLPDHLHAIWTLPEGDCDYSGRWSAIKALFSRDLPAQAATRRLKARREKGIWQRRFWEHHIRDAADLAAHRAYCWTDPVRHGLVMQPQDWAYSSYHRDAETGGLTPCDLNAPLPRFPTGERPVGRALARPGLQPRQIQPPPRMRVPPVS